jgi:hypothetical protein
VNYGCGSEAAAQARAGGGAETGAGDGGQLAEAARPDCAILLQLRGDPPHPARSRGDAAGSVGARCLRNSLTDGSGLDGLHSAAVEAREATWKGGDLARNA